MLQVIGSRCWTQTTCGHLTNFDVRLIAFGPRPYSFTQAFAYLTTTAFVKNGQQSMQFRRSRFFVTAIRLLRPPPLSDAMQSHGMEDSAKIYVPAKIGRCGYGFSGSASLKRFQIL